jgi:hypothetical protein
MSEALDMPAAMGGSLARVRPSKRKLVACAVVPLGIMGLLCTIDVQTMGQQKTATCEVTQQSVTVPKPHIWLAGAITGVMDEPTALRDVMASTHPDVALTQVVAANPTLALAPMGNVPPTYGGRACLTIPTREATSAPQEAQQGSVKPKAVVPGKGE